MTRQRLLAGNVGHNSLGAKVFDSPRARDGNYSRDRFSAETLSSFALRQAIADLHCTKVVINVFAFESNAADR